MDYIVVKAVDLYKITNAVNNKLKEGYKLQGGVSVTEYYNYGLYTTYSQAMVKE